MAADLIEHFLMFRYLRPAIGDYRQHEFYWGARFQHERKCIYARKLDHNVSLALADKYVTY